MGLRGSMRALSHVSDIYYEVRVFVCLHLYTLDGQTGEYPS